MGVDPAVGWGCCCFRGYAELNPGPLNSRKEGTCRPHVNCYMPVPALRGPFRGLDDSLCHLREGGTPVLPFRGWGPRHGEWRMLGSPLCLVL